MVKDGEIVYPGTELTQSGELPPRKGMNFYLFFPLLIFSFTVMMKMEFRFHTLTELFVYCYLSVQYAGVHVLN